MSNRYAGVCYRCGLTVPSGDGVFEKTGSMQKKKWPGATLPKWLTQHHQCAVDWRGTAQHYQINDIRSLTKDRTND